MNESLRFPPPDADVGGDPDDTREVKRSDQQIAHDRGRICKKRGCVVCAPLRARRQEKKQQRKVEARAALHAKSEPCGRASCEIDVCVRALAAAKAPETATAPREMAAAATPDPAAERRRQDVKHGLGLPCGAENCVVQLCVDGFVNERTRRHRKGRPCRSATCDTPICVAARSTS